MEINWHVFETNCLYFGKLTITVIIATSTQRLRNAERWRIWKRKKLFEISAPNYLPNNLLKYCTRPLNHPVYQIYLGRPWKIWTDPMSWSCNVPPESKTGL
jgi:hypothetical protein